MTNKAVTIVLFLLFVVRPLFGQSTISGEAASLSQVGQAIEVYEQLNRGQTVTDWNKFKEFYNFDKVYHDNGAAEAYLEDHYQFITQPLALPNMGSPYDGRQVLLLRTTPKAHSTSLGNSYQERLLLCRDANGRISSESVNEAYIQAMLKKAGVTITPKVGLPAIDTEQKEVPPPGPQPNPHDVEFLAKHPELNPANKQVQALQSKVQSTLPSQSTVKDSKVSF